MRSFVIISVVAVLVLATGSLMARGKIDKSVNTQVLKVRQERENQVPPATPTATPTPNIEQQRAEENTRKVTPEKLEADAINNETDNNIAKSSSTFTPTPTESPYAPTNESLVPTISVEQQKATKIISISDSLGNTYETDCRWSDTHYECPPKDQRETVVSVKATPKLTFTINAQDPNNRPLTYHYYYAEGCREEGTNWISSNSCTSTLKTNELGLRTFSFYVKNDDNYGSVGLDANTSLYYRIIE